MVKKRIFVIKNSGLPYEARFYAIKLFFKIYIHDGYVDYVEFLVCGKMQKPESVVEKPRRK